MRIEGHTDLKGTPSYNQKLSERRAEAVRKWLIEREGLTKFNFTTQGFGATRSKVPNAKPNGSDDPDGTAYQPPCGNRVWHRMKESCCGSAAPISIRFPSAIGLDRTCLFVVGK